MKLFSHKTLMISVLIAVFGGQLINASEPQKSKKGPQLSRETCYRANLDRFAFYHFADRFRYNDSYDLSRRELTNNLVRTFALSEAEYQTQNAGTAEKCKALAVSTGTLLLFKACNTSYNGFKHFFLDAVSFTADDTKALFSKECNRRLFAKAPLTYGHLLGFGSRAVMYPAYNVFTDSYDVKKALTEATVDTAKEVFIDVAYPKAKEALVKSGIPIPTKGESSKYFDMVSSFLARWAVDYAVGYAREKMK